MVPWRVYVCRVTHAHGPTGEVFGQLDGIVTVLVSVSVIADGGVGQFWSRVTVVVTGLQGPEFETVTVDGPFGQEVPPPGPTGVVWQVDTVTVLGGPFPPVVIVTVAV
jgi:hypothetical protein